MSGFMMSIPKRTDSYHDATPVKDSWYEERTALPANLQRDTSYPVIAVCKTCSGRIRLAVKNQYEWVHMPAEETKEDKQ